MAHEIIFNGQARPLPDAQTVAGLVASLELDPRGIAVERNRHIVPRSTWDMTVLEDGDVIELVQFVGGGC